MSGTKINDLIELYMESHDLVTTIGLEIAKLVDEKENNSQT